MKYPYYFAWGNNEVRKKLKGKRLRVIARGALNSALVEFEDGQRVIISRNAIRKVKEECEGSNISRGVCIQAVRTQSN